MWSTIKSIFTGGGVFKTIEAIATEAIETDKEKAEANALFIKTLDPNGLMRRDIGRFTCKAYGYFLGVMSFLLVANCFGWTKGDTTTLELITALAELWRPITIAFGAIVSASFGVNAYNIRKGK